MKILIQFNTTTSVIDNAFFESVWEEAENPTPPSSGVDLMVELDRLVELSNNTELRAPMHHFVGYHPTRISSDKMVFGGTTASGNTIVVLETRLATNQYENRFSYWLAYNGTRGRFIETLDRLGAVGEMEWDHYTTSGPSDMLPWETAFEYTIRSLNEGNDQPMYHWLNRIASKIARKDRHFNLTDKAILDHITKNGTRGRWWEYVNPHNKLKISIRGQPGYEYKHYEY